MLSYRTRGIQNCLKVESVQVIDHIHPRVEDMSCSQGVKARGNFLQSNEALLSNLRKVEIFIDGSAGAISRLCHAPS
jgi:hypothetical protein